MDTLTKSLESAFETVGGFDEDEYFVEPPRADFEEGDDGAARKSHAESIQDSLKKAFNDEIDNRYDRAREDAGKAIQKDFKDLTALERKNLAAVLRKERFDDPEQEQARKDTLAKLKGLEPEKKDRPETVSEARDSVSASVNEAAKTVDSRLATRDLATPEQRQYRSELKSLFPGKKLSETLTVLEAWGDYLVADPQGAWKLIAQELAKLPAWRETTTKETKGDALSDAYDDTFDLEDLAPFIEKYGADLPEKLKEVAELLQEGRKDPAKAAARLALKHGATMFGDPQQPPQPQQAQPPEPQEPMTPEQKMASFDNGLEQVIKSNKLPGFETPEMQNDVADVMESPDFPWGDVTIRTADGRVAIDGYKALQFAYQVVKDRSSKREAEQAARFAKARQSVTGAPSHDAVVPARGGGIHGSLERAYVRMN